MLRSLDARCTGEYFQFKLMLHNELTIWFAHLGVHACYKKEKEKGIMLAISELLVLSLLLFHATHCSIAVLGRVKDFIGVMADANKRLQLDAQVCSSLII